MGSCGLAFICRCGCGHILFEVIMGEAVGVQPCADFENKIAPVFASRRYAAKSKLERKGYILPSVEKAIFDSSAGRTQLARRPSCAGPRGGNEMSDERRHRARVLRRPARAQHS